MANHFIKKFYTLFYNFRKLNGGSPLADVSGNFPPKGFITNEETLSSPHGLYISGSIISGFETPVITWVENDIFTFGFKGRVTKRPKFETHLFTLEVNV